MTQKNETTTLRSVGAVWGGVLLFLAGLSFIFQDALATTYEAWQQEEYGHGFLIVPLALLLLFNRLCDAKIQPRLWWPGLAIAALGLLAHLAFTVAGLAGMQPQLLVLFLACCFYFFYGKEAFHPTAAFLLFLFFAVPLPRFLYYILSLHMQLLSTDWGVALLQLFGQSVYQDGNVIDLGENKLQVIEACNGLRYLFPLLSLGYLAALLYRASWIKRVVLFLSAVPLAVAMNALRLFIIGITVNLWGPEMAEGFVHDAEGWALFAACLLVLVAEMSLLQKIGRAGVMDWALLQGPNMARLRLFPRPVQSRKAVGSLVALLVFFVALQIGFVDLGGVKISPVYLDRPLSDFPMQIGAWSGQPLVIDRKSLEVLGTDDYLLADYKSPADPAPVNLYVLYYIKQDGASNQAVHTPTGCIPGGGWKIETNAPVTLDLQTETGGQPSPMEVNRLEIAKDVQKQLVYYWYVQEGRTIVQGNMARLLAVKNAFLNGQTNGAMIRISTAVSKSEPIAQAEARLSAFMQQSLPVLLPYIKEEKKESR